MNSYKFSNKHEVKKITWTTVIVSLSALVFFTNIDIGINKSFSYLLVSLISFIIIMRYVQKSKKTFWEIIIMSDSYKLYFFYTVKNPVFINKNDVDVVATEDEIFFNRKDSGELIGVGYKNALEREYNWSDLLQNIK